MASPNITYGHVWALVEPKTQSTQLIAAFFSDLKIEDI